MDTTKERKFIGSKAVIEYNEEDMMVKFVLDDGSGDTITSEQFEAIAKPARYDDGMVRVYKFNKAVSEITAILLKNRVRLIEKDFVLGQVDSTIVTNYQKAAAYLFGSKFEEFIDLKHIDDVLKGIPMNEDVVEEVVSDVVAPEAPAEEVAVESAPEAEVAPESAE